MDKKMISLKEASEIFGIPKWTLYKMSALRQFPIIKLGRKVYIKVSEFESWLNQHSVEPRRDSK
ncbi:MAG: helix-turn-helix domain-containing protein [Thermodesulfobacteriota bacterium]